MDIKNKQKSDFNSGNIYYIVTLAIINSNLPRLDSEHRFVLLKVIKDFCSQYYFQTNYNDCAPRGREKPQSGWTMVDEAFKLYHDIVTRAGNSPIVQRRIEFSDDGGDKKQKQKMLIDSLNVNLMGSKNK